MELTTEQVIGVVSFLVLVAGGLVTAVRYLYVVQIKNLERQISELTTRLEQYKVRSASLEVELKATVAENVTSVTDLTKAVSLLSELKGRIKCPKELYDRISIFLHDVEQQ